MAVVKTVKPAGGGDYTSLASWENDASTDANGVGNAGQWAECYTGGNLGALNISGWNTTPDSTNYPKIYVADGNNHLTKEVMGAYISSSQPIQSSLEYVIIEGLRVEGSSTSNHAITFEGSGTSNGARVDGCYMHGSFQNAIRIGQSSGSSTSNCYVVNNLIAINGSASNTPVGLYVYSNSSSAGTTNAYIYNNTIRVHSRASLTNYGLRFYNLLASSLNITVENNIIVGNDYTTCYNQGSFSSGTKTFNNNISSDSTSDDFGGQDNQINKNDSHIWDIQSNWTLFPNSAAYDKGKTIAFTNVDILGTARPQKSAYDIGAFESPYISVSKIRASIVTDSLIQTHEFIADELIDGPTGQDCSLIYPLTKNSSCPNCIYNPRQKRSSNIYKTGGPVPFQNHTTCPWCGGEGKSSRPITEDIRLRVYWSQKDWSISRPVENPDSSVMVIGYITDLPKLEKSERIQLNKNVGVYRKWICERSGESVPWGLSQDRYFAQMLKRSGGG
tara:strand:+ start:905 stop:2410 length:1506 start_codon:yes stop_codon:yes gene_type:complete